MLKVTKHIPTDVRIVSIKSDSTKNVTIVAEAKSYAELGYLVSQMKFEGILDEVQILGVQHNDVTVESSIIRATIGGVLP